MTGFKALLRLQLLSRYADLKPRNLKTALKEKKGRTIGMFIAILFLVVYLGVMLYIIETNMMDILIRMQMPEMLISLRSMISTLMRPRSLSQSVPKVRGIRIRYSFTLFMMMRSFCCLQMSHPV